MKLKITQAHIDDGVQGVSCACPIALAAKEHAGEGYLRSIAGEPIAGIGEALLIDWKDGRRKAWKMPRAGADFIDRFDRVRKDRRGRPVPVKPCEIDFGEPFFERRANAG